MQPVLYSVQYLDHIGLNAYGDLVIFNEQTGNRIGVLNPTESRLVEYAIPSANPNWATVESH